MQAQEQAPAHTNALARNTYKRGCVHARPRVSVSTQQRHSALRRTGKCVRFPFLRSLQVPRLAARTQVSSLPESIGNCRKLQSLCAAPAPAHHAWVLPACACMLPISCSNACLNRIIVSVCAQQDTRTCACAPRATHRSKGTRECTPTHEPQTQACHARSTHAQAHAHRRMHTRTHTNSCARARARTFALECVCLAFH